MRRTQEGYSPFKDDKPKDTENSPFEASSVLVVKAMFYSALKQAKEAFNLEKDDNVVLTGGQINGKSGNSNIIKIEKIN